MNLYLAKVDYAFNDFETILGIFSSKELAQEAIEKEISWYQKTSNTDYRPYEEIEHYILDVNTEFEK
jgi:hypothetical protein